MASQKRSKIQAKHIENLRSKGFPSVIVDINKKKKGIEV